MKILGKERKEGSGLQIVPALNQGRSNFLPQKVIKHFECIEGNNPKRPKTAKF